MHKDRLGRPLSVGDRVLIVCAGSSVYTFYATITRFVKSRIYVLREGYSKEFYKNSTYDFIYVEDQLAVDREHFPEYYI